MDFFKEKRIGKKNRRQKVWKAGRGRGEGKEVEGKTEKSRK